ALVDDARIRVGGADAELVIAAEEVVVLDVGGGRHQTGDIDLRARPEEDARGVDDPDLPVRQQGPHDAGDVPAGDAVERDRARARLDELHRRARGDAEGAP